MRQGHVYQNGKFAGILTEVTSSEYVFRYDDLYYADDDLPAISLTLSKSQRKHRSTYLFPFFFNMLSEGINKRLQCRHLRIDEKDDFGLLLATARHDTIGAVTIHPTKPDSDE